MSTVQHASQSGASLQPLLKSASENVRRDWLNHVAGAFRAAALVQTDVLLLQSLMLTSSGFTIYRLGKDGQRTAVAYAVLFASLSAWATYKLASDRLVWLSDEETKIYDRYFGDGAGAKNLTRPMFKKLLSCATFHVCEEAEERVLTRGEGPRLLLLLEGEATIRAPSDTASTSLLADGVHHLRRSQSVHQLSIVRGPGLYGEVSFVRSLAMDDSRSVTARADVTLSRGSKYIAWEGRELKTLLRSDKSLSNAVVATLSLNIAKKLTDSTTSVGKTTKSLQQAKLQLDLADYKRDAVNVALHALVDSIDPSLAHRSPEEALTHMHAPEPTAPGSGALLFAHLDDLRAKHKVSAAEHERVLRDLALIRDDDERRLGPRAPSLLQLCARLAERGTPEAPAERQLSLGRTAHAQSRIVHQVNNEDSEKNHME